MKKIILAAVALSICFIGVLAAVGYLIVKFGKSASDPKNIEYVVSGETFALKNGMDEKEIAPGSQTKSVLAVFGEPVYGDLDSDGDNDAAALLVHDPGGSGTFYYAVLAIYRDGSYQSTNALLLGDRIAPQTVEIHDGRAVYNYAVRRPDEPMTARPSLGKSTWIHYDKNTGTIGEWVKDFEGEANQGLREAEARVIAEKTCIKGGESLATDIGSYNENSRTWWFDANLNGMREGCKPACVVDEITKTAEINWRCTGLKLPE